MDRCIRCNGKIWPMQRTERFQKPSCPIETYHWDCYHNWQDEASLEDLKETLLKAMALPPKEASFFLRESKYGFRMADRQRKKLFRKARKDKELDELMIKFTQYVWKVVMQMNPSELTLIAIVAGGPTILDIIFQYFIHRHMENGRPPCSTCALRSATSKLDNIEW